MALPAIFLDPEAVATPGRTEIPLEGDGISVFYEGVSWGDQEVKMFMAEGLFGSKPIDHEWPLRTIKIPLVIEASNGVSFDDVRRRLEAWTALVNHEGGGWLKRVLGSGRHGYFDIVEAKLNLTASWLTENRDLDREATLELQALPEFYGDEVVGEVHEFTGDGAFTEIVKGTLPARVTSLTVTDKSGHNQLGLHWHFRSRNYSASETAKWAYNAEALELLDLAELVTGGSPTYGTKVVQHPKLSTEWTPVVGTSIGGATFLTHVGLYNVWVRGYTTSERLPWLRLLWDLGDMVSPSENVQQQIPGKGSWYEVNLGPILLGAIPFGPQRWKGVIVARGETGGESISIDRIRFECADEASGVLRASTEPSALPSFKASDALTGEGALSGSPALRGGTWEEAGDAEGPMQRTPEGAKRETKSDTNGRHALLSESTMGAGIVRAEIERGATESITQGIYLRWCSSTFWVRVVTKFLAYRTVLYLEYQAGGPEVKVLLSDPIPEYVTRILEASIDNNGVVRVSGVAKVETLPATFKKGEERAEGKIGIFDKNTALSASVRHYRRLTAIPMSASDAVVYANRNAKLSIEGIYRQSEDGKGYGPVAYPGSDLPRLPASGQSEAPVEIAVKPTRGDVLTLADSGKDAFTAQLAYRPCWSEIPQ